MYFETNATCVITWMLFEQRQHLVFHDDSVSVFSEKFEREKKTREFGVILPDRNNTSPMQPSVLTEKEHIIFGGPFESVFQEERSRERKKT